MTSVNTLPAAEVGLNETAAVVREYAGTPSSIAILEHLRRLELQYLDQLRTVAVGGLLTLQGKLAQVVALIELLTGEAFSDGGA